MSSVSEFESEYQLKEERKHFFSKNVGIIFIEQMNKDSKGPRLNFDQIACAHLLLQLNKIQRTFEFQVIPNKFLKSFVPDKELKDILLWFNERILEFENTKEGRVYGIDYWIGITSIDLIGSRFVISSQKSQSLSGKIVWVITSDVWDRINSPPSVFEYILWTMFMCSLSSLSREYDGTLLFHLPLITKGCLFDFTKLKEHRRLVVSDPFVCMRCKKRIENLERTIKDNMKVGINLYDEVDKVLRKEWIGDLDKKDSPIYNLKKNYGYDINRNSGFYKTWWERLTDSIHEKSAEWIFGGLSTLGFGFILAYIIWVLKLNS